MTFASPGTYSGQRWNLKHLAGLIAILALLFAVVGIPGTMILLVLASPAFVARPGRRLSALFWIATFYPLTILLSLYTTWVVAWFALGHQPRSSLDDPKDIDAIFVPYALTYLLLSGVVIAFLVSLALMFLETSRCWRERPTGLGWPARLVVVPMCWVGSYGFLRWDPLWVLNWFFD